LLITRTESLIARHAKPTRSEEGAGVEGGRKGVCLPPFCPGGDIKPAFSSGA